MRIMVAGTAILCVAMALVGSVSTVAVSSSEPGIAMMVPVASHGFSTSSTLPESGRHPVGSVDLAHQR